MSNLTPAQRGVLRRLVESATSADCDVGMDVGVLKAMLDDLETAEQEVARLRRVEAAARALFGVVASDRRAFDAAAAALRSALEAPQ